MAINLSGPISLGDIRQELRKTLTSPYSINTAENYTILNPNSPYKPNQLNPNYFSEWYGYDHEYNGQIQGRIFVGGSFDIWTEDGIDQYLEKYFVYTNGSGIRKYPFANISKFNNVVLSIAESSNYVFVGGAFTTYRGTSTPRFTIIDLTNAEILAGFVIGTGFNANVNAIVPVYSGGNLCVYVGGAFTKYKLPTVNRITRLLFNGNVDSSFVIGTGFNNQVLTICGGDNDEIYVGGTFTTYNGTRVNRITKLNGNGTINTSFVIGNGFNSTVNIIYYFGGYVYVGGNFTSYKGVGANRLVRLNTNGTVDTTFNIGSGPNAQINCILSLDGYIYVGGDFITFNGVSKKGLVRLNNNGSVDATFNVGTGFSYYDNNFQTESAASIKSIIYNNLYGIEGQRQILVGGKFSSYKGLVVYGIIGLDNTGFYDQFNPTYKAQIGVFDLQVNVIKQLDVL